MPKYISFTLLFLGTVTAWAQDGDESRNITRNRDENTKPLSQPATDNHTDRPFPGNNPWKVQFNPAAISYSRCTPESIRLSPDGKMLAVGCKDKSIRLWDLEVGREIRRLIGHNAAPHSISFSPDGKRIVSSAENAYPRSSIRVWSVATGEQLFEHKVSTESAGGVEYHPSGEYFVAQIRTVEPSGRFRSNSTEVFHAETFRHIKRLCTSTTFRKSYSFSTDGSKILLGDDGGYPFEVMSLNSRDRRSLPTNFSSCVLSPDGKYIAGYYNKEGRTVVSILDSLTLNEIRQLPIPKLGDGRSAGSGFRCVRFSPDGTSIFATTDRYWLQWNLETGKGIKGRQLAYASKGIIEISNDGQRMVELAGENQTILWDISGSIQIAKLHCLEALDDWAIETVDGYYQHGSKVVVRIDSSISSREREQYASEHRSSTMVARLLSGMSVEDARSLPEGGVPPTIALQVLRTEQDSATVSVFAQTKTPGGGIRDISVRVDGRELGSIEKNIVGSWKIDGPQTQAERELEAVVPFPLGRNDAKVQAIATDTFGQRSDLGTVLIERPIKVKPVRGRLFVLAVGVSQYDNPQFNLRFCHADAEALAETLLKQKGLAFGDVQVQVYTDKRATVTNIKDGLDWLKRSCTSNDVAIVLFSGHGIQKERGLYYVTHEANLEGVQYTCLNWETIAEILRDTNAKQILFLSDACYAGAFAQSDLVPQQELAASLRSTAGVMVFASSQGDEVSRENQEWGHGAFCKAILDGLGGKADANEDGQITILELKDSVSRQVSEMTDDLQHPVLPELGDFDPGLVIARTKP